ncbi:MAG: AraC family transcriptional regulator [Burkholderiales bacterium]
MANPAPALKRAGLEASALDDPDATIPFSALGRVLHESSVESGCEHFEILAGSRWSLKGMGLIGELMRHAPTLGDALEYVMLFHHINSGGGAIVVRSDELNAEVIYAAHDPDIRHLTRASDGVMAAVVAIIREMIGASWMPRQVMLTRSRPDSVAPYRSYFGTTPVFGAEMSSILFRRKVLSTPLEGADGARRDELARQLRQHVIPDLVPLLQRCIRVLMVLRRPDGDQAARSLAMNRRTLSRRLSDAGTTFQKELDEVRFGYAMHLLARPDRSIADVATLLCYDDVSSFARTFRRWSGMTPREWRTRFLAGDDL